MGRGRKKWVKAGRNEHLATEKVRILEAEDEKELWMLDQRTSLLMRSAPFLRLFLLGSFTRRSCRRRALA